MKFKTIVLIIVLLNSFAFGQNCFSKTDLISKAQEENKFLLLYFSGSDWCKPCIMLKKSVLTSDTFIAATQDKYILINYDFPQNQNNISPEEMNCREQMAAEYNAQGYFPKLVLINEKGEILKEIKGYRKQSAEEILDLLAID